MVISVVVALNFFESRVSSTNPLARSNSRGEVTFIMNKIVLQLAFTFFTWDWALVLIVFAGAIILAYYNIIDDPYYNRFTGGFYKVLSLVYLWSALVITILKIIESFSFSGGLIIWILGFPFLFLLGVSLAQPDVKLVTRSQVKFETDKELLDHLKAVLLLIQRQKKDRSAHLLLVGYIQKHKESCPEIDCPLKNLNGKEENDEVIERLIGALDRLFIHGVRKFKRSVQIRISYAFFLIERMDSRKKALEELSIAECLAPKFEDQFLIFRYKRIIEDNLPESSGGGGAEKSEGEMDIVGLIAFETHLKTCVSLVLQIADAQRLFWSQLLGSLPSLETLNVVGSQIDLWVKKVQDTWSKLSKSAQNTPVIMKLYAKFLSHVLNEHEGSKKLIASFEQLILKNSEIKKADFSDLLKLDESVALAVIVYNARVTGVVRKVNSEFCTMFGYNHEQIVGRGLDSIFPDLYKNYRPYFWRGLLERFLNRLSRFIPLLWIREGLLCEAQIGICFSYSLNCSLISRLKRYFQ